MKIICITNFQLGTTENLSNSERLFFCKPDTSLLRPNRPFYIPDFTKELHFSLDFLIKINRLGKNISKRFAHRYYNDVSLGFSIIANDLMSNAIKNNQPWGNAVCFDNSSALGNFVEKKELNCSSINKIALTIDNKKETELEILQILEDCDATISEISKYISVHIGDLIYLRAIYSKHQLQIGNSIEGYLNDQMLVSVEIK